jgi:hypothetical protein
MAPSPEYEPLQDEARADEFDDDISISDAESIRATSRFSWLEYSIFLLLGIAMLWAWYVSCFCRMTAPPDATIDGFLMRSSTDSKFEQEHVSRCCSLFLSSVSIQ